MKMIIGKKLGRQEINKVSKDEFIESVGKTELPLDMDEIKSRRGRRSKVYSIGCKKMMAEFYVDPVHYYDAEKGEYKEIDNRFIDDGEVLETRANTFKSRFNKHLRDGKVFEMEKDLCKVGLKSLDAAKCGVCNLEVCECAEGICDCNKVLVKNVSDNTDIEYVVDGERIKENIIVKERAEKYEYDFDLSLDNLVVGVSADGKSLELTKKDTGRLEFYIPSPVMFDSTGERSEDVYYEVEQDNSDTIKIMVIASSEWINDENRVFPITIDPQVISATQYNGYYYYDAEYEDSLLKCYLTDGNKEWGGEPQLYYSASEGKTIETRIHILKSKLPSYLKENYQKVLLKIKAKPDSVVGGFSIGYGSFTDTSNEYVADITSYFSWNDEDVDVYLLNTLYRGPKNENNIKFYPPTLVIEYENKVVKLSVRQRPNKTTYIPGEEFKKDGMIIDAVHEDGSKSPLGFGDVTFSPSGSLASYDKAITIIYNEDTKVRCTYSISIEPCEYWFDDRRADNEMENVYELIYMDEGTGQSKNEARLVRLSLKDGASDNRVGTPLNAATFNKLIKKLKDKKILD